MDISTITLGTLTELRTQPNATGRVRYHRVFPKAPLKWLIEQLEIDSCQILQLTKAGDYVRNGVLVPDSDIKHPRNNEEDSVSKCLLDIRFPKSQWQRRLPFYKLEFARKVPFTSEETEALKAISGFYGDYLYERIFYAHKMNCEAAKEKIENICKKKNKKPGTIVWRYFTKIHKAIAANSSFLLFLDENNYIVHYVNRPTWQSAKYSESNTEYPLTDKLKDFYTREDVFLWRVRSADDPFAKIIEKHIKDSSLYWDCLVCVSKHEGKVFALQLFLFPPNYPLFRPLYDEFLESATTTPIKDIKEVFLKRTETMIVDPIYTSRNFGKNRNDVFVIMPFSESWSNRIWKKMIGPMIEANGFNPARADDLYGRDIMEDIWKGICGSRFVVAEITGRNPNVFYE